MSTPPSRPHSPAVRHVRSQSFRSSSPSLAVQIEHQIPNHPHLHIHTVRSPLTSAGITVDCESAVADDEVAPSSSISAHILAPILNAPVPSSFKTNSSTQTSVVSVNGQTRGRGVSARANALGSLSRSNSVKRGARLASNGDKSFSAEYVDAIGDGRVDHERLEKIRYLARDRGIPGHLRKVPHRQKTASSDIVVCLADFIDKLCTEGRTMSSTT